MANTVPLSSALSSLNKGLSTKTANETNLGVQTINTNDGTPNGKMTMQALAETLGLLSFTGNVGVCSYDNDYLRFRLPTQAAQYKNTAVGVWVRRPDGVMMIVAKDSLGQMNWSKENVSGGTTFISSREAACKDFDGREKTKTIVSTLGADAYAAYACNNYASQVEGSASFVGAGRWWLPAEGELLCLLTHFTEINNVMKAIGGTPIEGNWFWSSTEVDANAAWRFGASNGSMSIYEKGPNKFYIRPVTAFFN